MDHLGLVPDQRDVARPNHRPGDEGAINASPLAAGVVFTTGAGWCRASPTAVAAEFEAREITRHIEALRHFKLADAECYSAADREAILGLISKWWTDRESGVSDPERLRQLGFHRFERFVRYELTQPDSYLSSAGRDWGSVPRDLRDRDPTAGSSTPLTYGPGHGGAPRHRALRCFHGGGAHRRADVCDHSVHRRRRLARRAARLAAEARVRARARRLGRRAARHQPPHVHAPVPERRPRPRVALSRRRHRRVRPEDPEDPGRLRHVRGGSGPRERPGG